MKRRNFLKTSAGLPFIAGAFPYQNTDTAERLKEILNKNERIREAREVALKILQPSRKELEHGMELHFDSLVVDSYGFAPRSAVDGNAMQTAINDGASPLEIKDMQEDMNMTRYVEEPDERREFVDAWEAAGVTCIFQNAGEEGQDIHRLIKRLARFTYAVDMLPDFLRKGVTPEDILTAKQQRRHCLYFSANGVPLPQDWVSVEEEMRYMRIFFQLGIRMMHVTYNRRNMLGDGCAEKSNGGLSDFGRAAIAEMNKTGVIVDVAHAGHQTSLEAAQVSEKPIVASHTGCSAIRDHIRCKTDAVMRAIVKKEGIIGMCCIPRYLGGSGDISALLDHIDYVVKRFGIDYVAIGTDVAYMSRQHEKEMRKVQRPKTRDRWAALWPPDDFVTTSEQQLSMAWTNWPMFTVGLVQRGYADEDIRKIIGGNMIRVARDVLS